MKEVTSDNTNFGEGIEKEARAGLRTWLEIDTLKLNSNIKQIRNFIAEKTKLCAVVKSNAYGHGLIDFSKTVADKVDYFAVDSIVEGIRLRKEGIKKPIMVLGYTLPELFQSAINENISITISSLDHLPTISKTPITGTLRVHIKIDTGLHRQGLRDFEKEEFFNKITKLSDKVAIEGVYTHFAQAKNPNDRNLTDEQIKKFESWKKEFTDRGFNPIFHTSATASGFLYPESAHDMIRVGIGLYGYYPSKETENHIKDQVKLQPILSWKALVSEVKRIKSGESIGYNHTWTAQRDSTVAIVPIGYWHGIKRELSNKGEILVNGKKSQIVGTISMDMTIIDITEIENVKIGDVITVIGCSENICQFADNFEDSYSNHSDYEFLTTINPLIKKFYI